MGETISHDLPELRARFAVQDFLVDLLGGLVPGLLFLFGLAFSILPVILLVYAALLGAPRITFGSFVAKALEATKQTPNTIWIAGFFVLVTIAYVVGHFFYRRGPKTPDQESFRRIKDPSKTEQELKNELGCSTYGDCEFPYPNLDDYLRKRGHDHLLPFVRWRGGNTLRSKTYINLLKIRLRYHYPEKCSEVIKNEAHVRLSSSTWYVARALRFCSLGAIGFLFLSLCTLLAVRPDAYESWLRAIVAAIIMPISVEALAEFGRTRIEKILHYQRMREVFFVLETSYIAFSNNPEALDPPFSEFVKAIRKMP